MVRYLVFSPRLSSWAAGVSASARHNDVISIAPILVRLSCILHNNGTATAVLAVPVPPPLGVVVLLYEALHCTGDAL